MEIKINVDEAKILELARVASLDELPRSIYYEAKKQAIESAVKEIKSKLGETPYYGEKESLYSEVRDYLYKQIEDRIKEVIANKFSEKNIESIVNGLFEKIFTEWIQKRVYEQLEAIKKDIFIGSSGQLEAEKLEAERYAVENINQE